MSWTGRRIHGIIAFAGGEKNRGAIPRDRPEPVGLDRWRRAYLLILCEAIPVAAPPLRRPGGPLAAPAKTAEETGCRVLGNVDRHSAEKPAAVESAQRPRAVRAERVVQPAP